MLKRSLPRAIARLLAGFKLGLALAAYLGLISFAASGQNDEADKAFCTYTTEQALAQRDLFRTPSLTVSPTQPSIGTAPQLIVGVTSKLSDVRKASLTLKAAHANCGLYTATTEAQIHILYAMPSIQKEVLLNRLRLIQTTSDTLNALISEDMRLVNAHNLTMQAVYVLESAKVRLDADRTATLADLASAYVPEQLSSVPLRTLVAEKLENEDQAQKAEVKLLKEGSWDIQFDAGVHQPLSSNWNSATTNHPGPYAGANFTYNFGRKSSARHFDNSVVAHNEWKKTQFDDVAAQAALLKKQIQDTIHTQTEQLNILFDHEGDIEKNLRAFDGVDTNNAIGFRNNLLADRLMLRLDIDDVRFRLTRLEQYLARNF
ncbi:MAG: hypothetical protein JO108_03375 [Acidobacteriaceae bacterium]|nr:hypothetical protein [Acidobacteriaceae bacterium]